MGPTVHWRRTSNPGRTATGQHVAAQAKPAHGRQEQGDRAWFGNRRLPRLDVTSPCAEVVPLLEVEGDNSSVLVGRLKSAEPFPYPD